jgi:hypothetical protein
MVTLPAPTFSASNHQPFLNVVAAACGSVTATVALLLNVTFFAKSMGLFCSNPVPDS